MGERFRLTDALGVVSLGEAFEIRGMFLEGKAKGEGATFYTQSRGKQAVQGNSFA